MEEKMIINIKNALPSVFALMKKQRRSNIVINYDKDADVVYFSFDGIQKADDTEIFSDDVLIRKKANKPVGITILHASSYLKK